MAYVISTIENHEAALARAKANEDRIYSNPDWEMSESGLSLWADGATRSFNKDAIDAINLGKAYGLPGPAAVLTLLVHNDMVVYAKRVSKKFHGRTKYSWLIVDSALAEKFGRKFVPAGSNSRIQKQLGLSERKVVMPVKNNVIGHCAFVGAAMSFEMLPDWGTWLDYGDHILEEGEAA